VGVAGFLGAGLARENSGERRFALGKTVERGDNVFKGFEVVHALGAAAEFAGSLWAAEKEDADDGDFTAIEVEDLLQAVLELGHAAVGAAGGSGHAFFLERGEGIADGLFVEGHDGIPIVFLIAGVDQGVEGKRVVVGSGNVLLDEGAENAGFDFGENVGHGDWRFILMQSRRGRRSNDFKVNL